MFFFLGIIRKSDIGINVYLLVSNGHILIAVTAGGWRIVILNTKLIVTQEKQQPLAKPNEAIILSHRPAWNKLCKLRILKKAFRILEVIMELLILLRVKAF